MDEAGQPGTASALTGMGKAPPAFLVDPAGAAKLGYRPPPLDPLDLADSAAHALFQTRPQHSARSALKPSPALVAGPGLFCLGVGLAAPTLFQSLILALLLAGVTAALVWRIVAALWDVRPAPAPPLADARLPPISVLVALHDEARVIPDLVTCLEALDYPAEQLQILFAIEADDHSTLVAARAAVHPDRIDILAIPPIGPRTKPKALNYALKFATGSLIAVYDAEDAPHPSQLKAAAAHLAADGRLGCVQAPLSWYNGPDNWLTRQFQLEYAVQFAAVLPLLARFNMPLPLGGTSNVFRRDALVACGAWDPFNVTEDADLGFRMARYGWRAGMIGPGTQEEAPITLTAWQAQRSRWLKGHLVSWLVQMRDPAGLARTAGPGALASLQLTLGWNVISALLHGPSLVWALATTLVGLAGAPGGPGLGLAVLPAGYLTGMLSAALAARRTGTQLRWLDILTMPAYWAMQTVAIARALRELGARRYWWSKTSHGVSATRREAPEWTSPPP
ncbi:glycosyltransferase [Marinicauda sp. Alg238-R41]|uniref:glycosyltransferase n=1 Tax=Marinicauda sp. Alg238-R41 TaxID=2993447 RepID=UPI0022E313D9|nr:glycosyltransferase [Marinicauda sp. Alg238-R41]